jgi:peptidoglycan/xylan/chitin deacetylase (PgdA/CDA1 family)
MYPGFKPKAATFSYDDGISQDRELLSLLRQEGFKATFNLNSGHSGLQKIRTDLEGREVDCSHLVLEENVSLYAGMEIASHSYSHPFLETLPYQEQSEEISKDKENLEKLFQQKIIGFAYPYGTYNSDTLKALAAQGILYARTVQSTYEFHRPYNFLLWHPTIHHNDSRLEETLKRFLQTEEELAICYIWGHAYEFALQHNFSLIGKIGKMIGHKDDIWYATNGEICSYIKAAELVYYKKREEGFFVNPSEKEVYLINEKNEKMVLAPHERRKYE